MVRQRDVHSIINFPWLRINASQENLQRPLAHFGNHWSCPCCASIPKTTDGSIEFMWLSSQSSAPTSTRNCTFRVFIVCCMQRWLPNWDFSRIDSAYYHFKIRHKSLTSVAQILFVDWYSKIVCQGQKSAPETSSQCFVLIKESMQYASIIEFWYAFIRI